MEREEGADVEEVTATVVVAKEMVEVAATSQGGALEVSLDLVRTVA